MVENCVLFHGTNMGLPPCGVSVFEPVEVPQWAHRYSYKSPFASTSSNLSLVGVATRQRGQ